MSLKLQRIGKIAMIAALTDEEEEAILKEKIEKSSNNIKLAITVVAGVLKDVKETFVKSIIGCALQNNIVNKNSVEIHGVLHGALDALIGITHQIPVDASIKMKVALVTDGRWIAIAIYGDSAIYPLTNHERGSLTIMHISNLRR